jgi:cell division protein FtsI (penicillin-binding protein 3)
VKLQFSSPQPTNTTRPTPAGRQRTGIVPRRFRFLEITGFFLFWITAICCRLVWLQVVRHADFVERAARQQQRTFEVAPRRGMLYDRNLHELAMTVLADSVYAVPSEIALKQDPDAKAKYQAAAAVLAKVVHRDPTDSFTSAPQIAARLNDSRDFAWVARKLDPAEIAQVKALNLKGVYFQKEFKRFYPNSELAAQVLGYVGTDDNGLGGLESLFNRDLHGVPGRMLAALDARRHVLGSEERDPEPGENLVLTIDENIQFIAERALDAALARTHALSGTVVVQDPYTGQILALAIRPTFNLNDFRHATRSLLRDHAVTDVYEPGSTFKLVTYSAALDQKLTNPNEVIDCQGGKITLAGRVIHDDHPNGLLTTSQALWESSDVAAIKLALRMGSAPFYQYIRAYGFGSSTGIELPGETYGLLRKPSRWSGSSIGSIAIGQEVAVTPLQLISMVSTLANGGVYMPPHILMTRTEDTPGDGKLSPTAFHPEGELPDTLPEGAHRVVSSMTSAVMRKLMEGVVLFGTGRPAALNGYSAGGKTGTAQKIDVVTHRYSKTEYVASFVGIAPVSNPAITVAVVIDSPKGDYYGTAAAAPVFRDVAQQVLEYLGIPHDTELKSQTLTAEAQEPEEPPPANETGDLSALFDEVNDLPQNDPLRTEVNGQQLLPASATDPSSSVSAAVPSTGGASAAGNAAAIAQTQAAPALPTRTESNPRPGNGLGSGSPSEAAVANVAATSAGDPSRSGQPQLESPLNGAAEPLPSPMPGGTVVVDAHDRVAVPAFVGEPVRQAVESAGNAGLSLEVVGSGIAREQVPVPGTMVPPGTGIVVRFSR